jgi:membrane-associated phospholipid phosphatase
MLDAFDHFVMSLMSDWTQYSALLNKFIVPFLNLFTIKTLPVFAGIWLLWFSADAAKYRPTIVNGFVGMFLAGAVSRAIQDCLPERLRPLHSGDPGFKPPLGLKTDLLEHWSSFPSDHAAVFFALSTALWRVSRPIGAISYAWTIFIICIPRLFGGYHYASDIIGGAVIGILVGSLIAPPIGVKLSPYVLAAEKRRTALFYAAFFALSFQFATMFNDVRQTASEISKLF